MRGPLLDTSHEVPIVRGLVLAKRGQGDHVTRVPSAMTIGADGRRSVLARALGLSRHPARPRRWAFGAYATGVGQLSDLGEMHIRPGRYLGIAPLGRGVANVCVVTGPRPDGSTPREIMQRAIAADRAIADRFVDAHVRESGARARAARG